MLMVIYDQWSYMTNYPVWDNDKGRPHLYPAAAVLQSIGYVFLKTSPFKKFSVQANVSTFQDPADLISRLANLRVDSSSSRMKIVRSLSLTTYSPSVTIQKKWNSKRSCGIDGTIALFQVVYLCDQREIKTMGLMSNIESDLKRTKK